MAKKHHSKSGSQASRPKQLSSPGRQEGRKNNGTSKAAILDRRHMLNCNTHVIEETFPELQAKGMIDPVWLMIDVTGDKRARAFVEETMPPGTFDSVGDKIPTLHLTVERPEALQMCEEMGYRAADVERTLIPNTFAGEVIPVIVIAAGGLMTSIASGPNGPSVATRQELEEAATAGTTN